LDAETKRPIERYRLLLRVVFPEGEPREVSREAGYFEHPEGRFQSHYSGTVMWANRVCRTGPVIIGIEAPGYQPAASRPIHDHEENVTLDILMRQDESG